MTERKLTPAAEAALGRVLDNDYEPPAMSQFLNKDDLIAELRKENGDLRTQVEKLTRMLTGSGLP